MDEKTQPIGLRALIGLAVPLAAVQLGHNLLGTVDLAVVGRLGAAELAGVGLGAQICFITTVVGFGVMLGLDPLVSQALGSQQPEKARAWHWQGVWLTVVVTVPTLALAYFAAHATVWLDVEPEVALSTRDYLLARMPGMIFFLGLAGHRSYLQAIHCTRPLVVGMVVANVLNLPISWCLVFGDAGLQQMGIPSFGIPALGSAGAGYASSIASLILYAIATAAMMRLPAPAGHYPRRPSLPQIRQVLKIGIPIGATILAEAGIFTVVAIAAGTFGARELAAHNLALSFATLSFQVVSAIGAATCVLVGNAVGRHDPTDVVLSSKRGLVIGLLMTSLAAAFFIAIPESLGALLTDDMEVIRATVPLLMVAAAFQWFDGAQVIAAGALRGLGDTQYPLWANVIGHYAIGFPIGSVLAWGIGLETTGLWIGLSAGLATVSVALAMRLRRIAHSPLEELSLE